MSMERSFPQGSPEEKAAALRRIELDRREKMQASEEVAREARIQEIMILDSVSEEEATRHYMLEAREDFLRPAA